MWWLLGNTGLEGGGFGSRRGRASFSAIRETEREGERLVLLRRVWWTHLGCVVSSNSLQPQRKIFSRGTKGERSDRIFGRHLSYPMNQISITKSLSLKLTFLRYQFI